ncbi:hypothetical protein PMAYCL1PPCAC_22773, partial [Pristionchus mayeri]
DLLQLVQCQSVALHSEIWTKLFDLSEHLGESHCIISAQLKFELLSSILVQRHIGNKFLDYVDHFIRRYFGVIFIVQ